MTSILIRHATRQDARAIVDTHASASRGAGLLAPPGAMAGAPAGDKQEAYWRDAVEFAEPQLLVACDGDVVVGVTGFDRCRDPGTPPTLGEIWTLQVLPSHWGQGVGLALWDAAREGLVEEGCTEVSVWSELSAERAMRFLDLAGFKRVMSSARTATLQGVRVEQIRLKRKL
ncbi:MAG: GNAT family N-acetyltransferase [Rhodoferax sp.]|jgi:ribosomal protein S18 acetylase RimI-like enzyme|nr:GNAT family N-acetyltransferase [Rhodoferax sp.]